jgi:hypothetical protein
MDARATRHNTIVNGGISFTATPTKKKEPPHKIDKIAIRLHSFIPITLLTISVFCIVASAFIISPYEWL